jgi:integrase
MPVLKLTARTVASLRAPAPSGKPVIFFDESLKGFGVLCSGKTATKSYVVQRDLPGGVSRRVTIAPCNLLTLEKARELAAETLLKMLQGTDPKVERKAAREAAQAEEKARATLRWAAGELSKARPNWRPKTRAVYDEGMCFFCDWLDVPLRDITREMVEARHKKIAGDVRARNPQRSGASSANGAMRLLRIIINFAKDECDVDLPSNPVRLRRQWFPEPRRVGHVRPEDLHKFYAAVRVLPNDVARDYLTLLLFTGMRRSEAASLTWDDVDLENKTLRVPSQRTKSRRELRLPLTDVVFDMLAARRALGRTQFVFPARGMSGHIAQPKFPLALVAKNCGVRVTVHDLRRTFITVAESCGLDGYALKALVNHSIADVTGGYVMMNPERLREPAQRVCDRMKRLCGIDGNVVRLVG